MGVVKEREDKCTACQRLFTVVDYHSKNMCRSCYNVEWSRRRAELTKKQKLDHCVKCMCKWGSTNEKGKTINPGSHGMCKMCYQRLYNKNISSDCKRCGKNMGKKTKGHCSMCKIELEEMKSPGRRTLPDVNKIKIDRVTKETMRRLFNRYKYGLNTLVDPFVVTDIYLTVFSSEATKGQTASKTEFNLDQFDEESQVIAMLKLLKKAYDKC